MENEIIVQAGCEGGDITLYGVRQGKRWLFNRHLVDHIDHMLFDGPWIEHDSEVVSTWTAALKLLDHYQFHLLFPLQVHPEFRTKVLKAVTARYKRRGHEYDPYHWQRACGLPKDESSIAFENRQ